MERILQGTAATISTTYYTGPDIADPGTVTVTITRADGTPVVTGAATTGTGAAPRTFALTPAQTATLDRLTATWHSVGLGDAVTRTEVVGGFLFTTAQLRALLPDETAYPDDKLREARIYAETELERALGYALVPRFGLLSKYVRRAWRMRLRPELRVIRSVTIGGTALSQASIANMWLEPGGWLSGYYWFVGQVVVAYEHGLDADNELSAGANRAALNVALEYLGATVDDIDPRATRLITDDGTIELASSAQGAFSTPAVNRWVSANGMPRAA